MKRIIVFIFLFSTFSLCAQKFYKVNSFYRESFDSIKPLANDELDFAFRKMKEFKIPFKYPQGGCESRAYFMGMLLDSLKIPNSRVWIYAANKFKENDLSGGLHIIDPHFPKKEIVWGYHTAPIVLLQNGRKTDTIVLDPSLDENKPLKLQDWFKKMGGFEDAYYSFVPNKYFSFYFPMQGNFYQYQDDCYNNMLLEKNLAIDKVGNYIYFTYIKEGSLKYNPLMVDKLIEMVSDINSFDKYITSNQLPAGLTERKLFIYNQEFIIDCKNQYNRQLKYWYKRISELSKYLGR